ncbi:mitotic spindle assembly checkpoint protein MAD1 isoform X1, partial [Tachysurus ichikawai]
MGACRGRGEAAVQMFIQTDMIKEPVLCPVSDLRKQMESAKLKNQRLREVFQKKIQEFRTACYVLTGYQIDITVENQYRLTSVYAERMDDSLLFK